jgi:hypothetical protein
VTGDVVERRELGDEPDEERRELGDESLVWPEMWSSSERSATSLTRSDESSARSPQRGRRRGRATRARRGVPSVTGDVVEQEELDDELEEEQRELDEESLTWPETWSSDESSMTILTRSDESSTRSRQRDRRRGRVVRARRRA